MATARQYEGIELAHASLNPDAVFDYLLTPRALKAHFTAQKAPLCFVGHTHVPEIWIEGREDPLAWPKSGGYPLEPGRKTVINVGSVGQPRGDDKRATWATFDPWRVRCRCAGHPMISKRSSGRSST